MRTIWQSLAWKEWHEHKWNLVSILAILCGVTVLVASNVDERNLLGAVLAILMLSVAPLAIFIGMGTAAGERSRGTLPFLQALPVPLWRVALLKFIAGLATVIIPYALVAALTYGICQLLLRWGYASPKIATTIVSPVTNGNWLSDSLLLLTYLAICFFVWTIGTGVHCKNEISAAAVALLTMLGWAVVLTFAWSYMGRLVNHASLTQSSPFVWIATAGAATIPGGLITLKTPETADAKHLFLPLAIPTAALVYTALAARYVFRFGKVANLEVRSPITARAGSRRTDWLGPPRYSAITSIAWKQFREGWLAALTGLTLTFGLFASVFVTNWRTFAGNPRNQVELINGLTGIVGFVIAMILGVGVFSGDVSTGLNTFWRSRPIQADMWFWIKFLTSLAIAVAAIYLPVLLVAGMDGVVSGPDANIVRMAQVAVFAAAVAMICLVRQSVYAAILSIAVVYLGIVATALARALSLLVRGQGWPRNFFELNEGLVNVGLLVTFVFCTMLAWLAVRNDWGQKSVR